MKKPDSLRAHLTAALPELLREPDALALYVTEGRIAARIGGTLGFEYRYTAELVLLNFRGDPAQIFFPLLTWLSVHQADLLLNHQRGVEAIAFTVDVVDQQTVDVEIKLPLTQAVDVAPDGVGGFTITERDEQPHPDLEPLSDPLALLRQIYGQTQVGNVTVKELLAGYPED